jgi:hypothetical protein
MNKLLLTNYKGKFTIIEDEDKIDKYLDEVVGEISREDAIRQVKERCEACLYYGIPPIFTSDKELKDLYNKYTDIAVAEDLKKFKVV